MTISGNFKTAEKEVDVVKHILEINDVSYEAVTKYTVNWYEGDVLVALSNGKRFLIEVKE